MNLKKVCGKGLARKFMLLAFLCTTATMTISVLVEIYFGYRQGEAQLQQNLGLIETAYLPAISESVFELDNPQVSLLLQGILQLKGIVSCQVNEPAPATTVLFSRGSHQTGTDQQWDLVYHYPNGEHIRIGRLRVYIDPSIIHADLWQRISVKIIASVIMIGFTTIVIMVMFQHLVARHLYRIARFAKGISLANLDARLTLDRKASGEDELDQVTRALTALQARIKQDIEEKKQAESALVDSEKRLESVIDNAPVSICLKDIQGRYVMVNRRFETLFKTSKTAVRGKTDTDIFPAAVAEQLRQNDRAVISKNQALEFEELVAFENQNYTFFSVKFPLHDAAGKIYGLSSIATDVTQKTHRDLRLREIQKMESIGTLASGIAHDFNNLLFPILGISEILLMDMDKNSQAYRYIESIHTAGKRGRDLVRQILSFSRQSEHKLAPVFPRTILREACKLIRSTLPSDIELILQTPDDVGQIMADAIQIHQVIMNLITNAFHAVEACRGKIFISLGEVRVDNEVAKTLSIGPCGCALLTITDTGTGIAPENLDKIFEPYFTTKAKGKGTGLGLSTVYGIVKDHGGDIKIHSRTGEGTTVEVYLPLMLDQAEENGEDNGTNISGGNERILLVDDEEEIVFMVSEGLTRLGYQVDSFTSSTRALGVFARAPNAYDLVITDMTMPVMTGDRLAQALKTANPELSIIILTGFSERLNPEKAAAIGIRDFLMKPLIFSDLARRIRQILDEAAG